MATSREAVAKIYGQIAELENNRLATHPMEREITLRAIRHGLSTVASSGSSSKLIVEIGGGPGKLAFALADEGHTVDLIDLSPDLIRLAQAEQDRRIAAEREPLLRSIGTGNALDGNAFDKDVYDAVLLLGPLYHLLDELERKQAVENALELANPKCGSVFCAFVSREAHLRDLVTREPERLVKQKNFYTAYLATGRYESDEIRHFFQKHFPKTLELISLRSTEGILGGGLDTALIDADAEVVRSWADLMLEKYSENEVHLGCADHLLAVLRRK
ncbi:hypothetical protein MCOR14_009332 [Pyricularia oryzae]|nr:hypothetical protein MCOR23_010085 [Pyricularia oryzae]KAI6624282.1 hypothetical protein MCOR14_009332 [Pyricularia oryzae]